MTTVIKSKSPGVKPRHWLSFVDHEPNELAALVKSAREIKAGRDQHAADAIFGRILGMVFFNPSLRTRTSFEAAMMRFGGHAITLNVGGDTWNLEYRDGVVMNGAAAEHIREAAPVLSRYCNIIGVRTFAGMKSAAEDAQDALLRAFARFATVPVVSLESATEHPCQALADWMTIDERFGSAAGRRFTLTWAPQAKATPMAVPHSAVLCAAAAGMNLTIAHPPGYELNADVLARAKQWCDRAGTEFMVTHDQAAACASAEVLYVKSWGSPQFYGDADGQRDSFARHANWMVTQRNLATSESVLMHCLPVRRNVVIADDALDDSRCIVVDQAENRMWAQAAILANLLGPPSGRS
ncbi:MAG: N-acetylornithine carbamoyltransferase [Phycisphaerales bacterium]|nr:N-acetylornithine carbamoyltransferase [Phycisphaerales bacterium]